MQMAYIKDKFGKSVPAIVISIGTSGRTAVLQRTETYRLGAGRRVRPVGGYFTRHLIKHSVEVMPDGVTLFS